MTVSGRYARVVDRILLIDGHSVAYRAFFALPVENFATSTGQHTNAVFGFTSMLINVVRDEEPTHVAVAFDVSRDTFRTQAYADYKGTRDKTPDEFKSQIPLIEQVLDAVGIRAISKDGYEADDIIATLSTEAEAAGMEVLICTGDRDCLQLVSDHTTVLYPRRGVSDLMRMTPDAVHEKYSVKPEQYPELAALVGETSDNLPGVPGVGPKTAAKWIGQFGSLDEIIAKSDSVPGKAGQSLREHIDDVLRNRRLNALVRDLELPVGAAELGFSGDVDRESVHTLFDALEFDVLRTRMFEAFGVDVAAEPDPVQITVDYPSSAELPSWLAEHAADGVSGVQVVGSPGVQEPRIDGIAIAAPSGAACWIEPADLDADGEQSLARWWSDPGRHKLLHDAKGQLHAVMAHGWTPDGVVADTAIAAYLLRPDQRTYDLSDLAVRHLNRQLGNVAEESGQLTLDDAAEAAAAVERAGAVRDLWPVLDRDLAAGNAQHLLQTIEMPIMMILARMERTGIAIDTELLDDLYDEFSRRIHDAAESAYSVIGRTVNLGSPKQLQDVLFDQLEMPKTKRTKTGYTTDADSLSDLYVKTEHPFLAHLLNHRDVTKLRQTVEGLRKAVNTDGRIHTTFQQTIAATGRLSSIEPNLQNIPIRTDSGRRIRQAFVVGPGYETLLTADYSQIEMRIMAHLSEDADLIAAFNSGADFHTVMAAKVFGVDPEHVDTQVRARIKAMNYGLAYGLSAYGLSQQLGISAGEAQGLMDEYFARFGGVRDYLQGVVAQARESGYTETMLGRRRYLPDLGSDVRQRRQMAERMALNAPIQGSAADIIKLAMIGVAEAMSNADMSSRMLLQVHDELAFEVAPGELQALEALVREQMGSAIALSVPLDVSVGIGQTWFDAGH